MHQKTRLLIGRLPLLHEAATQVLDLINGVYFRRLDRREGYRDRIRALRGSFGGQRCFVVGNGPSLTATDLDLIGGEISFASNRIFESFNDTAWRPTFYFAQDVYDTRLRDFVEQTTAGSAFVGSYFHRKHRIQNRNVIPFNGKKSRHAAKFSGDCSASVGELATVSFTMLQFACYFGFESIYLLGMDHNYRNVVNKDAGSVTTSETKTEDHFYPSPPGLTSYANLTEMTSAFELSANAAARTGVRIFNATRGGSLEVFPRVSLEEIVSTRP